MGGCIPRRWKKWRRQGTGGGDLRLLLPYHSCTVQYNQDHYGPLSGGGESSGVMGGQLVVVTRRLGLGRDADVRLGGGTDGGGGVDGWDGDRYRPNRWKDTAENAILETEPNSPLAYAPGL